LKAEILREKVAANKRFGEIGVKVTTRTSAHRLIVSDNPNCVQSRPNFAKPPGRYLQADKSSADNKLENRTLNKILTVRKDIKK